MSSPVENSSSNHSSSPESLFDYPIHPEELANLLHNREGRERLYAAFEDDIFGEITIRMFASLTNQIQQLDRYVTNLRTERHEVYQYGICNQHFEQIVTQFVRLYRERQADPYLLTPPTPYQTAQTTPSNSPPPQSESSPRSVVIHPEEASAIQENPSENDPSSHSSPRSIDVQPEEAVTTLYHTVDENEPGSPTNPIDMDLFLQRAREERQRFDTPHPIVGILHRRVLSAPDLNYCTICTRTGHLPNQCIHWGVIVCDYCNEVNHHLANQCPEWRRNVLRSNPRFQYCILCGQTGHTLDGCAILG